MDSRNLRKVRDGFARLSEKRSMLNTFQHKTNRVGDTVFAASRQVWLAGLGAAVVTRDWAEKEAAGVFRTLVKEGAAGEAPPSRLRGGPVESSMIKTKKGWKHTRPTGEERGPGHARK